MPESRNDDQVMNERLPCVYLLASKRNGTLYTGVTSCLQKRVWEHKNNVFMGFTKKYNVHTLVWYEVHETMESAIQREKSIKNRPRAWKIKTIEEMNPGWSDLYSSLL
jgi:putative endonuclease